MTQAESSPAFGRFVSRYRWIYCYTASHQLTSEGFQQAGLATDSGGDGDFIWPHLFLLSSSDSRFLSQWNQILALKQQRSLGAFSRHKLGPAPHFLSCSHTATCLLQVWDGVLLQPGPHRAPQGPAAPGGVWREGRPALRQTHPSAQPQDTSAFVSNSKKLEASCSPLPWHTVAVTTSSTTMEA